MTIITRMTKVQGAVCMVYQANSKMARLVATSAGTFPVSGPLFTALLVGTIMLVGALTFFPALSLGPIIEHFLMHSGKVF
jgi:K+-transporting ATPase ATPase A chain